MNIYELYGRQAEALAQKEELYAAECDNHAKTVEVFRQVHSGELPANRVEFRGDPFARRYVVMNEFFQVIRGLKSGVISLDQVEIEVDQMTVKPKAEPFKSQELTVNDDAGNLRR